MNTQNENTIATETENAKTESTPRIQIPDTQTAWMNVGTDVQKAVTAEQALKIAGLDWHVEQQTIQTESGIIIPDRMANVIQGTDNVLGIVSPRYEILQNADAFGYLDYLVSKHATVFHTAGQTRNGKNIFMQAKLDKEPIIVKAKGSRKHDIIDNYLTGFNNHSGEYGARVFITPTRIVCHNTLTAALRDAKKSEFSFLVRHVGDVAEQIKQAHQFLNLAVDYGKMFSQLAQHLVDTKTTKQITAKIIADMYPYTKSADKDKTASNKERVDATRKEVLATIEERAEVESKSVGTLNNNLWMVFNGITYHQEHERTYASAEANMNNQYSVNKSGGISFRNKLVESVKRHGKITLS